MITATDRLTALDRVLPPPQRNSHRPLTEAQAWVKVRASQGNVTLPDADDLLAAQACCEDAPHLWDDVVENGVLKTRQDDKLVELPPDQAIKRGRGPCILYGKKLKHLYGVLRHFIRDDKGHVAFDRTGEHRFASAVPFIEPLLAVLAQTRNVHDVQSRTPDYMDIIQPVPHPRHATPMDELRDSQIPKLIGGAMWIVTYQCGRDIEATPIMRAAAEKLVELADTDTRPRGGMGWMMLNLHIDTWNQCHGDNLPNPAGAYEIHTRPPASWKSPRKNNYPAAS